jgi:hypothetical protein
VRCIHRFCSGDVDRSFKSVRLKKKNSNFLTLPELLRADSSESQGLFRGVVSRRHKSSQWKRGQNRQDMGDVDWHVPIDPDRAHRLGDVGVLRSYGEKAGVGWRLW